MGRGKALSEDAWRIVLNIHNSQLLTVQQLAEAADVSRVMIHRIAAYNEETGAVQQDGMRMGRPRLLEYVDTQVSLSHVDTGLLHS